MKFLGESVSVFRNSRRIFDYGLQFGLRVREMGNEGLSISTVGGSDVKGQVLTGLGEE